MRRHDGGDDMEDIAPKLINKIQENFDSNIRNNNKIKSIMNKIRDGTATYAEANEYSIEVGEALAKAYKRNVSSEILPDGRMYYNIANRVISPTMENNYNLITSVTNRVQERLNSKAALGLKAITPGLNQDRIDGIINRLSSESNFDDVSWLLDEPIVNFSQSIVDDSIKANSEFQGRSGLKPKIVRKLAGGCCDWCAEVAGVYSYPDVPKDVYRRHQRCRCTVEYDPGDGKRIRQDVHSKEWKNSDDNDIIEKRKAFGLYDSYDTSSYPHNPDGTLVTTRKVKRGLPTDINPYDIIDVVGSKGSISRTIYDGECKRRMRIDSTDHGFPKHHPTGAHKHIIQYDFDGNYIDEGIDIPLTITDRKEISDIL